MGTSLKHTLGGLALLVLIASVAEAYPLNGYARTGIRRLEYYRMILHGELRGPALPSGAQYQMEDIRLNLLGSKGDSLESLPPVDPVLQREVDKLFPNRHASYSLAVLDITPGSPIRYAERYSERAFASGSIGKIGIAAGMFEQLAKIYPDDVDKRRQLLKEHKVVADKWIIADSHDVPIFNPRTKEYELRPIEEGDVFSLYEWLDHMLSASSNAAASTVWKEAMLMRYFGKDYPPTYEEELQFYENNSRENLGIVAQPIVNTPFWSVGIEDGDWHLGSFFTWMGKQRVPSGGRSIASPKGLMQLMVALERGKIVDEWSSRELKMLLYMTFKRIRYASAPRLWPARVYFKSGSLYSCYEEPGFDCDKYMGNALNVMNSVAIVEHPDGTTYLVSLMSNVLRKNSAVEHQSLATFIDRIIRIIL